MVDVEFFPYVTTCCWNYVDVAKMFILCNYILLEL
jgi:hypothetical protein